MKTLAPIVGAIIKAIMEALLGKTIEKEENYEDVGVGCPDPFDDLDWK